jgi:hypothetical protein
VPQNLVENEKSDSESKDYVDVEGKDGNLSLEMARRSLRNGGEPKRSAQG